MKRVLLVCTANICRSPMAMGLLRERLRKDGLDNQVMVSSAGVYGLDGNPASQPGVEVLAERGIDIADHRAHTVDEQEIADADLVLVMEEAHRRTLFYSYPHLLGKIFLLSEMSGNYHDIKDPYRQPKEAYERTADEMAALIEDGYPTILKRLRIAL
ncbi:MAG TPA: low molecular weight protein arginine phosphatase [Anaerolineae bacterium]|nr:low molecular weight protein arginine phosphatase [Anaerolineae bacterium]